MTSIIKAWPSRRGSKARERPFKGGVSESTRRCDRVPLDVDSCIFVHGFAGLDLSVWRLSHNEKCSLTRQCTSSVLKQHCQLYSASRVGHAYIESLSSVLEAGSCFLCPTCGDNGNFPTHPPDRTRDLPTPLGKFGSAF